MVAVPRYALEIREPDGSTTKGDHESPDDEWYREGDRFEHEGRMLRVQIIRETRGPYAQELVCTPVGVTSG
jgi:hypothetical protein